MGQPMFEFEDDFISSVCMGLDNDDVWLHWQRAIDAGADALQRAVQAKASSDPVMKRHAGRLRVALERDTYVVMVPAEIAGEVMAHEMGGDGSPPVPTLRGGLIRGSGDAARAITQALEMT